MEEIRSAIFTLEKTAIKMKNYYEKRARFAEERKIKELLVRLSDLECMVIEDLEKMEEE